MRTNITIDDALIEEAMRHSGARTKREVVGMALNELVMRHRQRSILDLPEMDLIDPGYDVIAERRGTVSRVPD